MFHTYLSTCRFHLTFRFCLAVPVITLLLCACSTTPSKTSTANRQVDSSSATTASEISTGNDRVITPATSIGAKPDEDFIADWAKERAEYLRSLDYGKIDRQNISPGEYTVKNHLVDTRFYLDYAERLLFVDGNVLGAKSKISHAVQEYKKALTSAGNNKTDEMLKVKSELRSLAQNTQRVQPRYCDYPSRQYFNHVENEIEDMLVKL